MLTYFMVFVVGALLGSLTTRVYVAMTAWRDGRSDW
jgi:hypothetical protein